MKKMQYRVSKTPKWAIVVEETGRVLETFRGKSTAMQALPKFKEIHRGLKVVITPI